MDGKAAKGRWWLKMVEWEKEMESLSLRKYGAIRFHMLLLACTTEGKAKVTNASNGHQQVQQSTMIIVLKSPSFKGVLRAFGSWENQAFLSLICKFIFWTFIICIISRKSILITIIQPFFFELQSPT